MGNNSNSLKEQYKISLDNFIIAQKQIRENAIAYIHEMCENAEDKEIRINTELNNGKTYSVMNFNDGTQATCVKVYQDDEKGNTTFAFGLSTYSTEDIIKVAQALTPTKADVINLIAEKIQYIAKYQAKDHDERVRLNFNYPNGNDNYAILSPTEVILNAETSWQTLPIPLQFMSLPFLKECLELIDFGIRMKNEPNKF